MMWRSDPSQNINGILTKLPYTIQKLEIKTFLDNVIVSGSLTVDGSTVFLDSETVIVEAKNSVLGKSWKETKKAKKERKKAKKNIWQQCISLTQRYF